MNLPKFVIVTNEFDCDLYKESVNKKCDNPDVFCPVQPIAQFLIAAGKPAVRAKYKQELCDELKTRIVCNKFVDVWLCTAILNGQQIDSLVELINKDLCKGVKALSCKKHEKDGW